MMALITGVIIEGSMRRVCRIIWQYLRNGDDVVKLDAGRAAAQGQVQ
jgi:hypothetical protein